MSAPQAVRMSVRRWILTGSITAIAITGSIYGAGLKSSHDQNQARKRVLELGPEERIAQLDAARSDLVLKKKEIERKLAQVKARQADKETEKVKAREEGERGGDVADGAEGQGKPKMLSQGWNRWIK